MGYNNQNNQRVYRRKVSKNKDPVVRFNNGISRIKDQALFNKLRQDITYIDYGGKPEPKLKSDSHDLFQIPQKNNKCCGKKAQTKGKDLLQIKEKRKEKKLGAELIPCSQEKAKKKNT